jgi:predicted ArsR family transcriptional regulator
MLELLGGRQRDLLTLLLEDKGGLTVYELSDRLGITRNAVRQHLAALENDGLVAPGTTRASGGRPEQLYLLTEKGRELFPRQYSWLAQLLIESVQAQEGTEGAQKRLADMGAGVARQLRLQYPALRTRQEKVEKIAGLMADLGYRAKSTVTGNRIAMVEADNCVFHELALKDPAVCQFDLALLAGFTDSAVEHQECMAKGGHVCRFAFGPR